MISDVYERYEAILAYLTEHGVPFTIHEHAPSHTVADAKERELFPLERLVKTIAFRIKAGGYLLATLRGLDRIDYRKLAAACGAKRADVVRLTPEEVAEVFGVEVGSVSPISLREGVQVFFDTHVPAQETVFTGVGRADRTLEIQLRDLVQVTQGQVVPLISEETS